MRVPAVRGEVTLNVVSMMAGSCAGDEKPREATRSHREAHRRPKAKGKSRQ